MIQVKTSDQNDLFNLNSILEGRRFWKKNGVLRFENTQHNIDAARSLGIIVNDAEIEGVTSQAKISRAIVPKRAFTPPESYLSASGETCKIKKMKHQADCFRKFVDLKFQGKRVAAIFADMGTGKTKMAIDLCNRWSCDGEISGVLLIAKKGVHEQWATPGMNNSGDEIPSPIDIFSGDMEHNSVVWRGRPFDFGEMKPGLEWFCINFEATITKNGSAQIEKFISRHSGNVALVGDETHRLKNPAAKTTKRIVKFSDNCRAAIIMTGTPLSKNLVDEWSQFKILSNRILGHKYVSTFRGEFCVMGGFENRVVVGHRNLDKFKSVTAPYVFRIRKSDCLNLPEKVYKIENFEMTPEQKSLIREAKTTLGVTIGSGRVEFETPLVTAGKIQEISNGFLIDPKDKNHFFQFANPRIDALKSILLDTDKKAIVWCRFRADVLNLQSAFGDQAVAFFGGTTEMERTTAKEDFIFGDKRLFIATAATAAEGLDGLQNVCSTAIYYSNSFNSIERWQSEDRIHRIGMRGSATYVDLIAKGSLDPHILRNLKKKKSFSDLVLDVTKSFGVKDSNSSDMVQK